MSNALDQERVDGDEPTFFVRTTRHQALFLTVLSLCLYFVGNGRTGLWDRDEPRYAGAVREMRRTGEWIVPQFNDAPRYHKPILIYWLMGVGTFLGGDNPFGARLVSSLASVGTCLVVWGLARRLIGSSWGFLAALMYATAPIVVAEAKLATTDATLAFFLISAQSCLWMLSRDSSAKLAMVFWFLMAFATLTKGPVGPALIAVAGVASWLMGGPTACWRRLEWKRGVPLFLMLTVPWFLAVGIRTNWAFYGFALGDQLLTRIGTKMEEHGGFPGYYLVFSLITFYPWSVLVPPALLAGWAKRKGSPEVGFLLGWAVGPLVLLELIQTKLIHYYLPAFPALAILVAWFVRLVVESDWLTIRRWRLGGLSLSLLAGVGLVGGGGFVALAAVVPAPMRLAVAAMGLCILVGTCHAYLRFHRGQTIQAVTSLVGTWALSMTILGGWILPVGEPYRLSRVVGERLAQLSQEHAAKPVLVTYQEPGIIYALGRSAPTMKNWGLMYDQLQTSPALVAPMFPKQVEALAKDGRFRVDVLEELNGFNINKGQPHYLRFAKIRLNPTVASRGAVGEQTLVE